MAGVVSAQTLSTIALTGEPAPDGDVTMDTFKLPVLNGAGWVALHARTVGHTNVFHPELLLLGIESNLVQRARGVFEDPINFEVPCVNESSQMAIGGLTITLGQQRRLFRAERSNSNTSEPRYT